MKYNFTSILLFICINMSYAQLSVQDGTNLTVLPGTTVNVDGNLSIAASGHIDNFGAIRFNNDLINLGNQMLDGDLVAMGDKSQFIQGRDSFSLNTLQVNNPLGVQLLSKVSVINALEIDKGVLYTSNQYPVYFLSTAASPNETVDGYIDGTAVMLQRNISSSTFAFLGSKLSSESGNNLGKIGIRRTTGDEGIISIGEGTSIASNWQITAGDIDNKGSDIDLTLSWLPAFDNNKDIYKLGLYGTVSFDPGRFQSLDVKTSYPTVLNAFTQRRSYERKGLDLVSRTFTLAGKNVQVSSIPPVNITTFPNPATDHINLLLENFESWADDVVVKVTDAYGKVFQEKVFILNGNLITIKDIGYFPTGIYRIFISRGQLTKVINFVKQ